MNPPRPKFWIASLGKASLAWLNDLITLPSPPIVQGDAFLSVFLILLSLKDKMHAQDMRGD